MSAVEIIGLAASFSLLAGWRLYACVAIVGLAMRLGLIDAPSNIPSLEVLANPWVIGVASVGRPGRASGGQSDVARQSSGTESTPSSGRSAARCWRWPSSTRPIRPGRWLRYCSVAARRCSAMAQSREPGARQHQPGAVQQHRRQHRRGRGHVRLPCGWRSPIPGLALIAAVILLALCIVVIVASWRALARVRRWMSSG